MFGFRKKTFVAPWFVRALINLTAVLLIYKIALTFTAVAQKSRATAEKNKKRRGRLVIKL